MAKAAYINVGYNSCSAIWKLNCLFLSEFHIFYQLNTDVTFVELHDLSRNLVKSFTNQNVHYL